MQQDKIHTWTVHIDGASRNNPGPSGAGIAIKKDGEPVILEGFHLGIKTNNQAEYLALLLALYFIKQYAKPTDIIRIASDSQLLVKQFQGIYRVRHEGLTPLHAIAHQLAKPFTIHMLHVMREDNILADALANKGIDSKKPIPADFKQFLVGHNITI